MLVQHINVAEETYFMYQGSACLSMWKMKMRGLNNVFENTVQTNCHFHLCYVIFTYLNKQTLLSNISHTQKKEININIIIKRIYIERYNVMQ